MAFVLPLESSSMDRPSMPRAIAFIDARLPNVSALLGALDSAIESHILNSDEDCIPQINRVLDSLDAVHTLYLVGHGAPGCLYLGKGELNAATLNAYASVVSQWPVQDIVLCGSQVGRNPEFLEQWHWLTGAGVAAATGVLGNGQWNLDVCIETIQTRVAVSGDYGHALNE